MKESLRIDVHHHFDEGVIELLFSINRKVFHMSVELDHLVTEVEETRTVIDSAIVLLQGLKTALDAAGTDPAKLAELSASLDAKQQELAAAIMANTPTP